MRPSPGLGRAEERWMVDTATIYRRTDTVDTGGGYSVAWSADGTTPAELAKASASERLTAAQEGAEITHLAKVPIGADVNRGDRLVVGSTTVEIIAAETATHSTVRLCRAREEPWDEPI